MDVIREGNLDADWRTQVQEDLYIALEALVWEARECAETLGEVRAALSSAVLYGSYYDITKLLERLEQSVDSAVNLILKVSGGIDSPTQVAVAAARLASDESSVGGLKMDAAGRVRVAEFLSEFFRRVKSAEVLEVQAVQSGKGRGRRSEGRRPRRHAGGDRDGTEHGTPVVDGEVARKDDTRTEDGRSRRRPRVRRDPRK